MTTRLDFVKSRGNAPGTGNIEGASAAGLAIASANFLGFAMIALAGQINGATVPSLREAISHAVRADRDIMLDLGRVTSIDREGVQEFLACERLCQRNQRTLTLVNPSPVVRRVMQALSVHRVPTLYDSPKEASKPLLRSLLTARCA
jgi:anti-anti-sigma factor